MEVFGILKYVFEKRFWLLVISNVKLVKIALLKTCSLVESNNLT
jgi:hypothetical protein